MWESSHLTLLELGFYQNFIIKLFSNYHSYSFFKGWFRKPGMLWYTLHIHLSKLSSIYIAIKTSGMTLANLSWISWGQGGTLKVAAPGSTKGLQWVFRNHQLNLEMGWGQVHACQISSTLFQLYQQLSIAQLYWWVFSEVHCRSTDSVTPIYELNHRNRSEAGRHQCSFVSSQFIHCGRFSWDFSTVDEYNDTLHEDCVELPRRSFKEADIS